MVKSKSKKKSKKASKKVKTDLKKTLKISHVSAVIYACVIIPVLLFAGFIGNSIIMKIIDSILLVGVAVLMILILKSYLKLSTKNCFVNNMSWIMILLTVIVALFNVLKLYLAFSATIFYIVTWVTAAIYIIFGISLFKMKKLSFLFSMTAIFYVLLGAFNASLVLAILGPALYVAKAIAEAFMFSRLMKKA